MGLEICKILIVDDHTGFRHTLKRFLTAKLPRPITLTEVDNGQAALALARELKPDLVLMDVSMPGINGIQAARLLKDEIPGVKVIILTVHDQDEYREAALRSRADGYVLKRTLDVELMPTIFRVCN